MTAASSLWPAILAALVTVAGWRVFLFLTDDAFIAFRYVSHRMLGNGLVWNPAPFQPVEGYTSFLWVALLELVWRVSGVEPPAAANPLGLVFGLGSLFLIWKLLQRVGGGVWITALALLGIVTNRTFLTWLSSGMETALFNFLIFAWISLVLGPVSRGSARRDAGLSAVAAALALTRPDGLLFVAATVLLLYLRRAMSRSAWWSWAPLLVVPAHLSLRRAFYGEWLPNTYWAKVSGAWPQAGVRYFASFVIEYGLWVVGVLAILWIIRARRRNAGVARTLRGHRAPWVAALTLAAHTAYYILIVGGDHFEYRVLSHLIPLAFLAAAWLATRSAESPRHALLWIALLVLVSWPIPWLHWNATRTLRTRAETQVMIVPIAHHFPPPLRSAVSAWDGMQAWLIEHHVGMRHQTHKVFCEHELRFWPTREEGSRIPWSARAVLAAPTVGVPGWVLPEVAIIDLFGLNDHTIARTRPPAGGERLMAHERRPPSGYVECFQPNVAVADGTVRVLPRKQPLRDEDIRACEERARR